MRKIIAALCALFIVALAIPASAIENVGGGGGVIVIAEQGKKAGFGYYVEGNFPWGINKKGVDSSITFELGTTVQLLYSDFGYKKYAETEAEVVMNGARKSLGFLNSYVGGGISLWHFRGTGIGEGVVRNTTRGGSFVNFSMSPVSGLDISLGAHIIPIADGYDTYAATLGAHLTF